MLALHPLIFVSTIFFTWFFARHWYAHDVRIMGISALAILSFLALGIVALVLCAIALFKNRSSWTRILGPIAILVITLGMITIYSDHYDNDVRAYVGIDVRGSEITAVMRWSSHFCAGIKPYKEALWA